MKVSYVYCANKNTGIGLRAYEIGRRLQADKEIQLDRIFLDGESGQARSADTTLSTKKPWPGPLGAKSIMWLRLGRGLQRTLLGADIIHLTSQNLGFMSSPRVPTVVTVHDLIEIQEPQDWRASLLNRYLYGGLARARHLIAVSQYTKQAIIDTYGFSSADISVIPNGVGPEFHFLENWRASSACQELRQQLNLPEAARVILFVGSEQPRKNIGIALSTFAIASKKMAGRKLRFIKVGEPGLVGGHKLFLSAIDRLGIGADISIVGRVSQRRLNELYNLADVLIYPSLHEGFGLPPLEAMAAGTPVICSNTTSLPEVVGEAAITHDPHDIEGMAHSLMQILSDAKVSADLRSRGIARARGFSWDRAAHEVAAIYHKLA